MSAFSHVGKGLLLSCGLEFSTPRLVPVCFDVFLCCAWRRIVDAAGLRSAHTFCMLLVIRACVMNKFVDELLRFFYRDNPSLPSRWT